MNSQTTVNGLFNGICQYSVPDYQRPYAWRVKSADQKDCQVNQFLDDIKEQDPNRKYYLGHFLFETISEDDGHYAVIDGQQRLTTVVIFMSSLLKACRQKGESTIDGMELERISQIYVDNFGQKFLTVPEDRRYFGERVLRGDSNAPRRTMRKSEQNIKQAADFFDEQFLVASFDELTNWFRIIHTANVTTYCLSGPDAKLTATQIFSFQNDRGKELTTLEKLKAFLMHQIYRYSQNNPDADIDEINSSFSRILSRIEELNTNEDTVLRWHCQAFLKGWDSALPSVKDALSKIPDSEKSNWILDFVAGLSTSFDKMVEIEAAEHGYSSYITDICYLDKENAMPLLLKLAHYDRLELRGFNSEVLKYIERILFKMTFKNSRNRTNSMISFAKDYDRYNFNDLIDKLRDAANNGFQDYWDFTGDCRRFFEENNNHYISEIRYVLYKYENSLRTGTPLSIDECSNIFRETRVQNTLDHISPQDPDYTNYSEDFKKRFLGNIGNLSLLVWGMNSAKSNHNPVDEKEYYNGVYLAQREVYDTLCLRGRWTAEEIAERRKKILEFVFRNWELGDADTIEDMPPEVSDLRQ